MNENKLQNLTDIFAGLSSYISLFTLVYLAMNDQAIWAFVWIPIIVASVLIVRNIVLSFIVPHPLLQRLSQPEAHKDPLVQELLLAWLFAQRL